MKIKKYKINIKQGDEVKIISGKHKGSTGKVLKIIRKSNCLIVENINIQVKHVKPKQNEEKGEIKRIERPIHRSNIKLYSNN
uniref:Large ribosomal subunit protein uL24c n=1 Tax=Plumaria plumosa TaxID=189642 RepID=A0A4D6WWN4_9FLOR|nr:ribosomal protein L24 [Plumaria plumosa]